MVIIQKDKSIVIANINVDIEIIFEDDSNDNAETNIIDHDKDKDVEMIEENIYHEDNSYGD